MLLLIGIVVADGSLAYIARFPIECWVRIERETKNARAHAAPATARVHTESNKVYATRWKFRQTDQRRRRRQWFCVMLCAPIATPNAITHLPRELAPLVTFRCRMFLYVIGGDETIETHPPNPMRIRHLADTQTIRRWRRHRRRRRRHTEFGSKVIKTIICLYLLANRWPWYIDCGKFTSCWQCKYYAQRMLETKWWFISFQFAGGAASSICDVKYDECRSLDRIRNRIKPPRSVYGYARIALHTFRSASMRWKPFNALFGRPNDTHTGAIGCATNMLHSDSTNHTVANSDRFVPQKLQISHFFFYFFNSRQLLPFWHWYYYFISNEIKFHYGTQRDPIEWIQCVCYLFRIIFHSQAITRQTSLESIRLLFNFKVLHSMLFLLEFADRTIAPLPRTTKKVNSNMVIAWTHQ